MQSLTSYLVLLIVLFSVLGLCHHRFYYSHLLYPYGIRHWQNAIPLFTNSFIHVNILHLLLNMSLLYVFGEELERVLIMKGESAYWLLFIFFLACLMASCFVFMVHQDDEKFNVCGASHGIFGVLVAYLVLDDHYLAKLFERFNLHNNLIFILLFAFTAYKIYHQKSLINYLGHLLGMLTGLIIALYLK